MNTSDSSASEPDSRLGCLVCLEPVSGRANYHARCLRTLFGVARLPKLDIELAQLHTAALAMLGHASLSGIQKKISLGLSGDRATLQVALADGRFLLKPQSSAYPSLPENEHLTTQLARLVGMEVADCALTPLRDGSPAFIVRRFDRRPDGRKVPQEDFCQLAGKSPKEKYDGTAELCADVVRRFSAEPMVELLKLFRQFVFAWWVGNGDLHLKNLSLTCDEGGRPRLSPAYDLVCTRLIIPEDPLALPVGGARDGLNRDSWRQFAQYCGLPTRAAERVLSQHVAALDDAIERVGASPLPSALQTQYVAVLRQRTNSLAVA